jgi:WD40 repeat protein
MVSGFTATEKKLGSVLTLAISQGVQTKLASGHSDGAASIWDLGSSSHLRHQSVHTGQLTGLSFSPKNSRLLATSGSDGRINLVDTASKSSTDPSASVNVGERLTCIAFSPDGIHSAVGTETGRIFLFDWRNLRSPVVVSEAHTPSPVKQLSFQVSLLDTYDGQ